MVVLDSSGLMWWKVQIGEEVGNVPRNYVEIIKDDELSSSGA